MRLLDEICFGVAAVIIFIAWCSYVSLEATADPKIYDLHPDFRVAAYRWWRI